jgi:hypothetical protein
MTIPDVTQRWIEAGKKLAIDASSEVLCPVHEDANLIVIDVPIAGAKKFERIMECPKCGAWNALLMNE